MIADESRKSIIIVTANPYIRKKKIVISAENAALLIPAYSSYLTNCCPVVGKRITNGIVQIFYGNRVFLNWSYRRQKKVLQTQSNKGVLLVVADLNIGDAINLQIACSTLKQLFPHKDVHYAINHNAMALIRNHPDINRTLPVFSGAPIPIDEDVDQLKNLVRQMEYEFIFNFCPFFNNATFSDSKAGVLNHYPLTIEMAYNALRTGFKNHLRLKIFDYLTHLFSGTSQERQPVLKEAEVYLNDDVLEEARQFLTENDLSEKSGLALFNPDATSVFTHFPEGKQIRLLNHLIDSGKVTHLLMGSGFVFKDVERRLLNGLGPERGKKVTIVPKHFSLGTYAGMLDQCDWFLTNDTGPLHLAATRKKNREGKLLRNKTAIFSVFGATPAGIYAYDSENAGYLPAPQDAPSHAFVSQSRCRNISCINKLSKRCKTVRCFDGLDPEKMADKIIEILKY